MVTLREPAGHPFEVTGHSRTPNGAGRPARRLDPHDRPAAPVQGRQLPTATPSPVAIASGTELTTDVSVTISVSGSCVAPLTVSFTPGSSGSPTASR